MGARDGVNEAGVGDAVVGTGRIGVSVPLGLGTTAVPLLDGRGEGLSSPVSAEGLALGSRHTRRLTLVGVDHTEGTLVKINRGALGDRLDKGGVLDIRLPIGPTVRGCSLADGRTDSPNPRDEAGDGTVRRCAPDLEPTTKVVGLPEGSTLA